MQSVHTWSINTKIKSCCLTLKTITTETIALKAVHSFKFEHVKFPRSCKKYRYISSIIIQETKSLSIARQENVYKADRIQEPKQLCKFIKRVFVNYIFYSIGFSHIAQIADDTTHISFLCLYCFKNPLQDHANPCMGKCAWRVHT